MKTLSLAIVLGSFYVGTVLSKNREQSSMRIKAATLIVLVIAFIVSLVLENAR